MDVAFSLNESVATEWQPDLDTWDLLTLAVKPPVIVFVWVSNIALALTIARCRELRTVSSVFLVSLVVADFLIATALPLRLALSLPQFQQVLYSNRWLCVGKLTCLFVPLFAHFYGMVAVALDRCLFLGRPLHYRRLVTAGRAGAATAVTWCLAMAGGTVPLYSHDWHPGHCSCERVLPSWFRRLVVLPSFSLAFTAVAFTSLYVFRLARRQVKAVQSFQDRLEPGAVGKERLVTAFSACLKQWLNRINVNVKIAGSESALVTIRSGSETGDERNSSEVKDPHVHPLSTSSLSEDRNQNSKGDAIDKNETESLVSSSCQSDLSNVDIDCCVHVELTGHDKQTRVVGHASKGLLHRECPAVSTRHGRRGLARLYLLVFGTFFACWAPTLGCLVAAEVGGVDPLGEQPWDALALLNALLNVLLHATVHRPLRRALQSALCPAKRGH